MPKGKWHHVQATVANAGGDLVAGRGHHTLPRYEQSAINGEGCDLHHHGQGRR
jgi:hypothetical protein